MKRSKITEVFNGLVKVILALALVCVVGYFVGGCEFTMVKKKSSFIGDVGAFVDGTWGLAKRTKDLIK